MSESVTYELDGGIAWIRMDDGKANAINPALLEGLSAAFDRAAADEASAVCMAGRLGFFSGGLDLKTLPFLERAALKGALLGYTSMTRRILTFPRPVIAVSAGHALAGGAVWLLACDWRIGCKGPFKYGLHEVSVSIPLPTVICELGRSTLDPRWMHRSLVHGEIYLPEEALAAGYLHQLVDPQDLIQAAKAKAQALAGLPDPAYSLTKERVRRPIVEAFDAGTIDVELMEYFG